MMKLDVRSLMMSSVLVLLVLIATIDHLGTESAGRDNLTSVLVVIALIVTIIYVVMGMVQQAQRR